MKVLRVYIPFRGWTEILFNDPMINRHWGIRREVLETSVDYTVGFWFGNVVVTSVNVKPSWDYDNGRDKIEAEEGEEVEKKGLGVAIRMNLPFRGPTELLYCPYVESDKRFREWGFSRDADKGRPTEYRLFLGLDLLWLTSEDVKPGWMIAIGPFTFTVGCPDVFAE